MEGVEKKCMILDDGLNKRLSEVFNHREPEMCLMGGFRTILKLDFYEEIIFVGTCCFEYECVIAE